MQNVGVFILSLVFLVGCGERGDAGSELASSPSSPKEAAQQACAGDSPRFDFKVRGKHVGGKLVITLNGLPVEQSTGIMNYSKRRAPLNTALIGEGNQLKMHSEPLLVGGGSNGLRIGEHEGLRGVVRCNEQPIPGAKISFSRIDSVYNEWSEQARRKWETYRSTVERGALDSMRAWASRHPMTVSTTFDNKRGPDFSRIFEEAPVLEDTPATRERLKDYAMRLRDLMAEKDTLGLFHEARPLFTDHDTGTPYKKGRVLKIISSNWFGQNWQLQLRRDQLGVRRWAEGRVWELYRRESGDELFMEGTEGASVLDIYVAEIDGQLTVVR
jgi:hypothetical protein